MFGFDFHPTLSIDGIITVLSIAIGGMMVLVRFQNRFSNLENSNQYQNSMISRISDEVKELKNVLVSMARFDERIIALQKEVADLRHGRGFIEEKN